MGLPSVVNLQTIGSVSCGSSAKLRIIVATGVDLQAMNIETSVPSGKEGVDGTRGGGEITGSLDGLVKSLKCQQSVAGGQFEVVLPRELILYRAENRSHLGIGVGS